MDLPNPNIREYIIKARKLGITDSKIIENLRKAKWPQDIIDKAIEEANSVIMPLPEEAFKEKETQEAQIQVEQKNEENQLQGNLEVMESGENKGEDFKRKEISTQDADKKTKKEFALSAIIAFLLSPIPFIGLAVSLESLQRIKSRNMRGTLIALLALLINLASIAFTLWFLYQIFTLPPDKLAGFAKYINDKFNLI